MNNICFQTVPLKEKSFFQKLFKQQPEENAIIEINNLLASKPLYEIDDFDISLISKKYNVNILRDYIKNLYEFYITYFHFCLQDNKISDEELFNLTKLKRIFKLNETLLDELQNSITSDIYKKSFQEIISDGVIDELEKQFIVNLQNNLRLSNEITSKISNDLTTNFVNNKVADYISDERLTPEEEKELLIITNNLGIKISDDKTKKLLNFSKQLWLAENSELTEININDELQKGEKCYFQTYAEWYEQKSNQKILAISSNINITDWKFICNGNLYLTNKRILLTSNEGTKNIRYSGIICQTFYNQGIEITKDAGKNVFLKINDNPKVCSINLGKLLQSN